MTSHVSLDDAARATAALYALGALPPREAAEFATHLATCTVCRAEVASYDEAVAGLSNLTPEADPPAPLRAQLMSRIGATPQRGKGTVPVPPTPQAPRAEGVDSDHRPERVQVWKEWAAPEAVSGLVFVPGGDDGWQPTDVDGVAVRRLFADPARDRVTMLVRMAAGTSYPAHRHGGAEECYVLEGTLHVGDLTMHAGDYQRAEGGSAHGIQSTETGCLLFIVSSLKDELLDSARV